jgi:hypothetical protein
VKRFRACTEWHSGLCTPFSTIGERAHCCQSGCRRYSTMFGLYTRAHPIEKQFRGTPRHTRTHAHTSTHIPTHIPTHARTHNSYRPPWLPAGSSLRPHFSGSEASQMPPPPRPGEHAPLGHLTSSHGASSSAGPLPGSRTGKARDACAWSVEFGVQSVAIVRFRQVSVVGDTRAAPFGHPVGESRAKCLW